MTPLRPLHVLLPTLGSAGDVHPIIALGLALQERGHRATIFANGGFRERIEDAGLGYFEVGTVEEGRVIMADPDLWHPRRGFAVVARRAMIPAIAPMYEFIAKHADADTIVATSGMCFGARVAQEKLGVPTASVHLQPAMLRSLVDSGMAGNVRVSASHPRWLKKAFFRLVDALLIDRQLQKPLNDFRARLGVPPIKRVFHRWLHSPQLVIGFFPEWFAKPQIDWPPNTHLVGFPLWDGGKHAPVPAEADEFLRAGEPPVIFTAGSAAATMHTFFRESVEAARQLGVRAMLVTNFPEQLPRDLPPSVASFGYLPFSEVLPRATAFVHHGGIGTTAQAIKAGVPQFVVPKSHDQFDNAFRVEQLGLGRALPQTRYRAARVVEAIRGILGNGALKARCREYSSRIDSAAALARACELLEGMVGAPAKDITSSTLRAPTVFG